MEIEQMIDDICVVVAGKGRQLGAYKAECYSDALNRIRSRGWDIMSKYDTVCQYEKIKSTMRIMEAIVPELKEL